jgi:hypothetical protein
MNDLDGWIELPERPGYRCKIFKYGNVTVRTFRPILSDTERQRREQQIMSSVGRILRKYDNLEDENETNAS